MYSLSQQDTSRDNRLNMLVESRVRREVQARFGGEFLETYRRNTARHRVLSLRMQALYPAAVVSVQIAEVPDLVSFRFAHVTIFVRKVFFVAEAARPMLDRLEFDFPSVHAVEQTEQTVFGLVFSGFGEQIHRTRLEMESAHSPHGSSEWTVSRTASS